MINLHHTNPLGNGGVRCPTATRSSLSKICGFFKNFVIEFMELSWMNLQNWSCGTLLLNIYPVYIN